MDIKFINKYKLNLIDQDISLLDQMIKKINKYPISLHDTQKLLRIIYKKILINSSKNENEQHESDSKLSEKISFEKWFNIKNIIFRNNNFITLPNDISKEINNKDLMKNIVKNMAKIAFLNKYIYENNKTHYLIVGCNIPKQSITITDTNFDVTLFYENYEIKNAPLQNINIKNKSIKITPINELVRDEYNYEPEEWEKVLVDVEKNFKNLKLGSKVKMSLKQYTSKIYIEYNKLFEYDKQNETQKELYKKFEKWIREGPDTLYENLKALNDFMFTENVYPTVRYKTSSYYYCSDKCDFYEECSSIIRYFGVDCTDESEVTKKDKKGRDQFDFAEIDRNIDNSDEIYWTHLRPITFRCDDPLWFLTLRIHFRILKPIKERKIKIGWIGRHLYLPCKEEKYSVCERMECPLYPSNPLNPPYDKKANELTNYRKQWLEIPSLETDESENSLENLPENH
jgi:hypothetical protein